MSLKKSIFTIYRKNGKKVKLEKFNINKKGFVEIKNLEISDDLKSNLEIDTQELTDKYIKKVDEMYSLKEKDILTL